jgi:hypothetical protein
VDFLRCLNTVLIAAFPAQTAAVIVKVQQICIMRFTYLHHRGRQKLSLTAQIHFLHLLSRFWFTHCNYSLDIWDTSSCSSSTCGLVWLSFKSAHKEELTKSNVRGMRWPQILTINNRYYSKENPHLTPGVPLCDIKVGVWCTLRVRRIMCLVSWADTILFERYITRGPVTFALWCHGASYCHSWSSRQKLMQWWHLAERLSPNIVA